MDKEVNRVYISKLYSENNLFDAIEFHDGVNIILGEKYDNATVNGRKTNGVGKSLSMEFLDFGLLGDYDKSRIASIPEDIVPLNENIYLELKIGNDSIVIERNRRNHDTPIIKRNNNKVSFDKIQDARDYLAGLVYKKLDGNIVPSLRNLFSILTRDERSEFIDIIKCHDISKRIPDDLTVHLYMLGFALESYKRCLKTIKEIEDITTIISKNKKELTDGGNKKIPDVRAELNALDDELDKIDAAIESFKSNETFELMESELLELEARLDKYRREQKALRHEYNKIKTLPKPEVIEYNEIELVYNQFKKELGAAVVKSLSEVALFKDKVQEFQSMLVNQKAKELEEQLKNIAEQIRILDDEYSEKMKIIDKKGVLKNLKISLKIYENKKDSYGKIKFLFDQYEKNERTKKALRLEKTKEIMNIDAQIDDNEFILKSFNSTILEIHEAIMGNKQCSFSIQTVDKARKKNPVEVSLRIFDDGSHSVNRTKVFIYDIALLFNKYTRDRHPLFLIHDNIFDVDQDTLVQCLNYLDVQEEKYQDFQYILTLNRDKIENEERLKLITMNIDAHKVATYTKQNKFLKRDYQER